MTLIHSFIHSLRSWVREERNPSPSVPVTSSSTGLEYRLWEMGADKCLTRARPACPYRQPKISLIKSSIPPGSDITSCRFSGVNSKPLEERDFPNTGPCPLTFHAADDYWPSRQISLKTSLKISSITLKMVWTALRRPGRPSNKNMLSLTSKGNEKFSTGVCNRPEGQKVGEKLGEIILPSSHYMTLDIIML